MSGEPSNNKSLPIVVRFPNWIGDCVMALPALRTLKNCLPESKIYVVAKEYLRGFFQNIEEIKDIVYIPNRFSLKKMIKSAAVLRSYSFTKGILFTNSFASALLFRLGGIVDVLGYKKDLRSFLLSRRVELPSNDQHHRHFYLDLVVDFCRESQAQEGTDQLVVREQEQQKVKEELAKLGIESEKSWFGMSTSAAYGTAKEWLPGNFSELINRLKQSRPGYQILLFGSEAESDKINAICQGLGSQVVNLAGKLTLRQSIEAISLCRLFISNDSGLMHVAASLSIPLVAIFGPTLPHKTAPQSKATRVMHHDIHCSPCLKRICPDTHECMQTITVDEVLQAVDSLLQEGSGSKSTRIKRGIG